MKKMIREWLNYFSDHPVIRDWTMGISWISTIFLGWIKQIFAFIDWDLTLNALGVAAQVIATIAGATVALLTAFTKAVELQIKWEQKMADKKEKQQKQKYLKEFYERERAQDEEKHAAEMKKLEGK